MEISEKILQKKTKKRKDILDSSYELFTTTGFRNTSIRQIAMNAGVAKGTFYLYFDSKEDVRDELIKIKSSELLLKAMAALDEEKSNHSMNAADQVVFLSDYILNILRSDLTLLKFISKNLNWSTLYNSKSEDQDGIEVIDFHAFIKDSLEKDGIKLKNPELVIYTILELLNSTCYNVILKEEPVSFEEYKPYLYDTIRMIVNDSVINK